MPRRTITEARAILETDILPRVNDYTARSFRGRLEAAEARAIDTAGAAADREAKAIAFAMMDIQRELTEVRDAYESEAAWDTLDAKEYARSLADLRRRERQATEALKTIEERIASVAEWEEHPIEFFDRITPPMAREIFEW
jgi:hypothetical protein